MKKTFKFLTCLFVAILCFGQMWATDTELFSTDFSSSAWSSVTFSQGNTETADVHNGITFYSKSSDKQFSISSGRLLWPNNNFGSSNYFMAIPVSNVNGSVTVTVTMDAVSKKTANVKYVVKDGETSVSTPGGSGTQATGTAGEGTVSFTVNLSNENKKAVVYLGRYNGNTENTNVKSITITTPAGGGGGDDPVDPEPDTKCFNMPQITSTPADLASVTVTGGTLTDANAASKAIEMDAKGLKFGGSAARLKVTLSSSSIVENTKITVTYECTSDKGSGIAIYNGDYAHKTMNESVSGKGSGSWSHTFTAAEAANYADEFMIDRNGGGGTMIVRAITVEDCGPELTKHTITLNYNDGVTPNGTIKMVDGKAATKPADPTWAHHRFDGWYNGSDLYVWTATVSGNLTLTAHWTQLYTVTYAAGDASATGDAPTQADLANGETFTVAANTFVVAGKDFVKWNDGSADYAPGATYTVGTANVTLTAQWKAASAKYTVHYMDADGTTPLGDDELVEVGQKPVGISATKPLYTFASWQLSGADIALDAASWASVAANAEVTLTARWTKIYAQTADLATEAAGDKTAVATFLEGKGYAATVGSGGAYDTNASGYVGYKFKNNGDKIQFNLQSGKIAEIAFMYIETNFTISVDGVETEVVTNKTTSSTPLVKYLYANSADKLISLVNNSADGKTSVINKITIRDPYQVSYNPHGADAIAAQNATPSVTLPTPANGTGSFKGWYDAEPDGTKIGNAGDTYFPTASVTLHAQWETVSSDNTLSDLKVGGETIDGFSPTVHTYYVVLPYGTAVGDIPAISATANSAKAKQVSIQQAVWTGDPYNCYRAQANVQAEDESWGYYDVRFSFTPKDGVSIIKVATTGGTNKTVTGAYAGEGDVNLSSSMKMDNGKYIGFTLDGTTLQAGDRINVHTSTAANTGGSHIIFYDNMTDKKELYDTEDIGGTGDNIFTINAAMVGYATAYVYRSNADAAHQWNGYVDYIEVTRVMNPVLTAISFNGVAATYPTTARLL